MSHHYPTPLTHPGLPWQRLAEAPQVVYSISPNPQAAGQVLIHCWNERTGAAWAKACSRPQMAPAWVLQFARLHG